MLDGQKTKYGELDRAEAGEQRAGARPGGARGERRERKAGEGDIRQISRQNHCKKKLPCVVMNII